METRLRTRAVTKMKSTSRCTLCSDPLPNKSSTSQELIQIRSVLEVLVPEILGILNESSEVKGSVFCEYCDKLLKEIARLHVLLETLNSELNSLLLSLKLKVVDKSFQVKAEVESDNDLKSSDEHISFSQQSFPIKQEDESDEDYLPSDFELPEAEPVSPSSPPSLHNSFDSDDSDSNNIPSKPKRSRKPRSTTDKQIKSSLPTKRQETRKRSTNDTNKTKPSSQPHNSKTTKTSDSEGEDDNHNTTTKRSRDHDFRCTLCSTYFRRKEDKFLHYENLHFKGSSEDVEGGNRLYSRICGKSSLTPGDLSRHNETFHASSLKFKCRNCNPHRNFTSKHLLKAHQVIHSTKNCTLFHCSLCVSNPITFDTPTDLDNHILRVHVHTFLHSGPYAPAKLHTNRVGPECDNPVHPKGIPLALCRWCGFKAKTPGFFLLRAHERKVHPEYFTFICSFQGCRSTFSDESHVLTCQETHKESLSVYKCLVCQITCTSGSELSEHLASKHTTGGVKCDECPQLPLSFTKRHQKFSALKQHKAVYHGGEWNHKCPICHKGCYSAFAVADHLRSAHIDSKEIPIPDPHECSHCGMKFATNISLYHHKQVAHNGQGNLMCELCGKIMGTKGNMKAHMRIHKGIKNNVCHICGKGFLSPGELTIHLRVHTGERPYGCSFCNKTFARTSVLTVHLRTHTGEKPYVCHICGKSFAQRPPMVKHFQQHKKNATWQDEHSPSSPKK